MDETAGVPDASPYRPERHNSDTAASTGELRETYFRKVRLAEQYGRPTPEPDVAERSLALIAELSVRVPDLAAHADIGIGNDGSVEIHIGGPTWLVEMGIDRETDGIDVWVEDRATHAAAETLASSAAECGGEGGADSCLRTMSGSCAAFTPAPGRGSMTARSRTRSRSGAERERALGLRALIGSS